MSVLFKDKITGIWKRAAANLIYASFPVGSIVAYGGSSDVAAPTGCMYCHGQVLNANDYPDLYAVIGTKFGTGDGSAGSFSLPDLQGQFLRGAGTNRDSTEGNGDNVGVRQKATMFNSFYTNGTSSLTGYVRRDTSGGTVFPANADKSVVAGANQMTIASGTSYSSVPAVVTARPTNTSVEYIIKVVK